MLNRKMIVGNSLGQKKPAVVGESNPAKRDLICIDEEEEDQRRCQPRKRRAVHREPKGGYCENCREKFDDFEEVSESYLERSLAYNCSTLLLVSIASSPRILSNSFNLIAFSDT